MLASCAKDQKRNDRDKLKPSESAVARWTRGPADESASRRNEAYNDDIQKTSDQEAEDADENEKENHIYSIPWSAATMQEKC